MKTVVAPGRDTDIIRLALADLEDGQTWEQSSQDETAVVILGGEADVVLGGEELGRVGGRRSVFEGAGHALYAPPGCQIRLTARGPVEFAVASAPVAGEAAGQARIIGPEDQRVANVGQGNWSRSVRTILGPEHAAARLLVGETINPPGNWSSYPPHKHDRQSPPDEVRLEEVYLFKVDPAGGFGVQLRYDDSGAEEAFTVRDNDAAAIKSGYHPVVAAPGYSLYYLWVMAGQGREMIPRLDPRHSWVQQGSGPTAP